VAAREASESHVPKYDLNGIKNKNSEKYTVWTNIRIWRRVESWSAIRIPLGIIGYLIFPRTKAYVVGKGLLPAFFQMLDNVVWRRAIKNTDRIEEQISTLAAHPFVVNLN
jgi:hypothetical protein